MASPVTSLTAVATDAEVSLDDRLIDAVRRVAASPSHSDALTEIVHAAADAIEGADHVSLVTVTRSRKNVPMLGFGASTTPVGRQLALLEVDGHDGPVHRAITRRGVVTSDVTDTDERWPRLRVAAADLGMRSVVATPLAHPTHDVTCAVMTLWSARCDGFDSATVTRTSMVGNLFAVGLGAAANKEQFGSALLSRDLIGQAKGMIMERYRIDAEAAFTLLARLSQDSNTPLATVAATLVNAEKIGGAA